MINSNLTYRATGRYMNGTNIEAYHLVGSDGSQECVNKDYIIFMIGKGLIENMRVQMSGGKTILRGKGINLNSLPIFDTNKQNIRSPGNQANQSNNVARPNTHVKVVPTFKVKKRIMFKTNCLGYILEDQNGQERKFSKQKVVELASQRLLTNATLSKYTREGSDKPEIYLRGIGDCNINQLPIVVVDQNGNIIDPTKAANGKAMYMRAVRMKRGGIIYDNNKGIKISFRSGDYIICGNNSILRIVRAEEASSKFHIAKGATVAVCDANLDNLVNYPVELFGGPTQTLTAVQVKKWPIIEMMKSAS